MLSPSFIVLLGDLQAWIANLIDSAADVVLLFPDLRELGLICAPHGSRPWSGRASLLLRDPQQPYLLVVVASFGFIGRSGVNRRPGGLLRSRT
jgi:hypothetical protein